MLKRSLNPVPTSSSLMRGFPMRCTCAKAPWLIGGCGERRTVVLGRDVVPHKQIVAAVEVADSMVPVFVNIEIGTSIAIEFTAYPDTASDARFVLAASCAALKTGGAKDVLSVSNAPPRSIQNASSVVPAKTLMPPPVSYVPAANSAS